MGAKARLLAALAEAPAEEVGADIEDEQCQSV
jgi:hypothetical protein